MYELVIENQGKLYQPPVLDGVSWITERQGAPGKLEFKVLSDEALKFEEGNPVRFKADGKNVFFGFIWGKKEDKDPVINVTAYDQLRYLKNKDTYLYTNKKASELLMRIAADFNLKTGVIEDTGYIIRQRLRDNETLFDIIYDALSLTFDNTKKLYVLYDDFGRLTLKNMESMRLDLIVGDNTAENYELSSTLDGVYNQIKLSYDNEATGKREIYIAKDSSTQNKWGKLQHFDKIDEKTNGQAKADTLLALFNRKARSLSLKNVLGDTRVRAGTSVVTNLSEAGIRNYMLVEKAKHNFSDSEHLMTLELKGRL